MCYINKGAKMAVKLVLSLLLLGLAFGQESRKEPIVLKDNNFEHLTQASTGATTGDWLVLFTKDQHDCPNCDVAAHVFKILTERLSRRMNIAIVDCSVNKALERRFKISVYPSVYFFRLGFQFAYMGEIEETKLENFVQGGYRDVRKEAVLKELSDFDIWLDDTINEIMVSIKERKLPSTPTLAIAIGTFLFCLTFLFCCCSGTRPEPVSKAKKRQ